ncbi:MAG: winged helix-turn-helix transcriptional regulator [Dehalococcoidia bacterium]|nr:winged helix-turn-helix transcriptional regulator [Dehalococcoidia bacterium]
MANRHFPFVTNHGLVLAYLARQRRSTTREIAEAAGITERTAYAIISDLVNAGYLSRKRVGRQNAYRIRPRFLHNARVERDTTVSQLFRALGNPKPREAVPTAER